MPKDQGFDSERHHAQDVGAHVNREVAPPGPGGRRSPSRQTDGARSDLLDVGPADQPYEQWSKGDLMNRAQQLGIHGALTHEQIIERIREAEAQPQEDAAKSD